MREERGQLTGDVIVYEPFTLWGSVGGNVRVIQGGKLYVRGAIYGNLTVEYGGRVHVYGNISGDLTRRSRREGHPQRRSRRQRDQPRRPPLHRAHEQGHGQDQTDEGDTTIEPGFTSSS